MRKPDPNASRVRNIITENLLRDIKLKDIENYRNQGELLFTEEDINATPWPLDRFIRSIMVQNRITEPYFNELYKIYAMEKLGQLPSQASNNRSNLVKALKCGGITYKRFIEAIECVLGYSFVEISMVIDTPQDGRQHVKLANNEIILVPEKPGTKPKKMPTPKVQPTNPRLPNCEPQAV